MILILEGPDGSGKTTFAKTVSAPDSLWSVCAGIKAAKPLQPLKYIHVGPPPREMLAEPSLLFNYYAGMLFSHRRTRTVFDRLALGERIYGPILRGKDGLGGRGWRIFRRIARSLGAAEMIFLPAYATCHKAWASGREELLRDETQLQRSYDGYIPYCYEEDVAVYNWESNELNWAGHPGTDIVDYIEAHENAATLPPSSIGDPRARFHFVTSVGEGPFDLPLFYSGGIVDHVIYEAGFAESDIMFSRAYTANGQAVLLPWNRITIALDPEASEQLTAQGIRHFNLHNIIDWNDGVISQLQAIRRRAK